jgi:hypothetical protein
VDIIIEYCKQDKDAMPEHFIPYLREIVRFKMKINNLAKDDYVNHIMLMAQMNSLVGVVAAYAEEEYELVYNERVRVYNEKLLEPVKNKTARAELAIADLRQKEAQWLGRSKRWKYAFKSIENEMNALKYKQKVDLADGNSASYYAS